MIQHHHDGQKLEMIMLGTGTSHGIPVIGCRCPVCLSTDPLNTRFRSGVLINAPEGKFLIDTSPDLRQQLLREKVDLVKAVLFTHNHADHIFGLDDLRIFCYHLPEPMPLYCEEIVENTIRQAYSYAFSPPAYIAAGAIPALAFQRVGLDPIEILGLKVQPIRLMHGKLPILGYRIGNVAFCTDVSHIPEESMAQLQGLDVLVLDALRYRTHPTHFSVDEAVQMIEKLQPKAAYLTHLCHDLDHQILESQLPRHIRVAYDGLRIPIT